MEPEYVVGAALVVSAPMGLACNLAAHSALGRRVLKGCFLTAVTLLVIGILGACIGLSFICREGDAMWWAAAALLGVPSGGSILGRALGGTRLAGRLVQGSTMIVPAAVGLIYLAWVAVAGGNYIVDYSLVKDYSWRYESQPSNDPVSPFVCVSVLQRVPWLPILEREVASASFGKYSGKRVAPSVLLDQRSYPPTAQIVCEGAVIRTVKLE